MSQPTIKSPKITACTWGRMEIEGAEVFKDTKLWPGGCRAWDWGETGTRHRPGVQVGDVEEILERGAEVVVLTRGVQLVLQVQPLTLEWLRSQGIDIHVLQTDLAVDVYHELVGEGAAVGGLFHSTC